MTAERGRRRPESGGGGRFGGGGPRARMRGGFLFGGPPFGAGPGVMLGHGPRARRGDVRQAALLLLAEEPRNGYQLMQQIEERSGGVWRPSPGSVYPALAQLEDEGLVRTEEREGRRVYALTDDGRAHVEGQRDQPPPPWEELNDAVDDAVLAVFDEMRQLWMAAVQLTRAGSDSQLAEGRRALGAARRALYALLSEDGE